VVPDHCSRADWSKGSLPWSFGFVSHSRSHFPVISRAAEGEPGHSILGPNMPIEEEPDCDPSKQATVEPPLVPLRAPAPPVTPAQILAVPAYNLKNRAWAPGAPRGPEGTARPRCVPLGHSLDTDESWFCQLLGVPLNQLVPLAREGRVCACGRHVIDEFGDHIHSCKKHTGSTKAAHETLLDVLEALCFQAGIKTERRNIPSVTKPNGKFGRFGAQERQPWGAPPPHH